MWGIACAVTLLLLNGVCCIDINCNDLCAKNQTTRETFELSCNDTCRFLQCEQGCGLWRSALNSSCQSACAGSRRHLPKDELYCVMGCHFAVAEFVQKRKAQLGTPSAPQLSDRQDALTNESVYLVWEGTTEEDGAVRYLVQWKYADMDTEWEYFRSNEPTTVPAMNVTDLQPYTNYVFRVAWLLVRSVQTPLLSEESPVIRSRSWGPPSTPPRILSVVAIDPYRVSVTWAPPLFPNGPILTYDVCLKEIHGKYTGLMEIKHPRKKKLYYIFSSLLPNTTYQVSVAAQNENKMGRGPSDNRTVTTPLQQYHDDVAPELLIAGQKHIYSQRLDVTVDAKPKILLKDADITGMAIHFSPKNIYLSDSESRVHKISYNQSFESYIILDGSVLSGEPRRLSVDWLHNHLYVAVRNRSTWHISRSDLEGRQVITLPRHFDAEIVHIEADPYNGYLVWAVRGSHGGLYRMDLGQLTKTPEVLHRHSGIGSFTIDHKNSTIYVTQNRTIFSVSLDGTKKEDIRKNFTTSKFLNVAALVLYRGHFHWTTGGRVYTDEELNGQFYYNSYSVTSEKPFTSMSLFHPSAQPIPVPVNPPVDVQAVFSETQAKVAWKPALPREGLGDGAWREWKYKLYVRDIQKSLTIYRMDINSTNYTISNLTPNHNFTVRVKACSAGKRCGPLSPEFIGSTLRPTSVPPFVLWGSSEGLLKSDILGDNVSILLHKSNFQRLQIESITWLEDSIFLVLSDQHLYCYNVTNRSLERMEGVSSATSVAADWVGKKLYWSNPKQQVIQRCSLDGSDVETLSLITVGRHLNMDSLHGFLYWSTSHSVECARLNGDSGKIYYQAGLFSGKRVIGLTLNLPKYELYWLVRSFEGIRLYSARVAMSSADEVEESVRDHGIVQTSAAQGPLRYFSSRLIWLQTESEAVTSDISGGSIARLSPSSVTSLRTFVLVHPDIRPYPEQFKTGQEMVVIPNSVSISSLRIEGTWDNFSIKWDPVININYGSVLYEVRIDNVKDAESSTQVVSQPSQRFPHGGFSPHTELRVTVKSFTFWGSSPHTTKSLRTPPSTPGQPKNLRAFVENRQRKYPDNPMVVAELRWDPPTRPNGDVIGYEVSCFAGDAKVIGERLGGQITQYRIESLIHNVTYSCQVVALTSAGMGEPSQEVVFDAKINSVSRLAMTMFHTIQIRDMDTQEVQVVARDIAPPVAVSVMLRENTLFWIDQSETLNMLNMRTRQTTKLAELRGHGSGLDIDWVAQIIYWSIVDEKSERSAIYKLDLNKQPYRQEFVVHVERATIYSLRVHPFSSRLLWTALGQQEYGLLNTCDTLGRNITKFFGAIQSNRIKKRSMDMCNCPRSPAVGAPMTLLWKADKEAIILWMDAEKDDLRSSDMIGCYCQTLIRKTAMPEEVWPPGNLAADENYIYWTKKNGDGALYRVNTSLTHPELLQKKGVSAIFAATRNLQTFPDVSCLVPLPLKSDITILKTLSDQITVRVPTATRPSFCEHVSMATVHYIIYYGTNCSRNINECNYTKSEKPEITLRGLKPYTRYTIFSAVENYYSRMMQQSQTFGPAVHIKSAPGTPSPPQNVKTFPMTPEETKVMWNVPEHLNGPNVHYMVVRQRGSEVVQKWMTSDEAQERKVAIRGLEADQTYNISIRSYSIDKLSFSESETVTAATLPLPPPIVQKEISARTITVLWTAPSNNSIYSHLLEYSNIISGIWSNENGTGEHETTTAGASYMLTVSKLRPNTTYAFRLVLVYSGHEEHPFFIWPKGYSLNFTTKGEKPKPPSSPVVEVQGDSYVVTWRQPDSYGAPILSYELRDTFQEDNPNVLYNGTGMSWRIGNTSLENEYTFSVRARSSMGVSDWSASSERVRAAPHYQPHRATSLLIFGVVCGVLVVIAAGILCVGCFVYRRKKVDEKKIPSSVSRQSSEIELSSLQEHSRGLQQNNILYGISDLHLYGELITVRKKDITLTRLIGRGAFGEVYEGAALNLPQYQGEQKVAIKTLREQATDQEKTEFLKEAQLMSNFKHPNILRLLGVCLDHDPNFIILELMAGGDLLSYLRSNRPHSLFPSVLTIQDLVRMCCDVASGCHYLEEMHFVHRDLACRNCLVTSPDPELLKVKVGDFGLARDIYKNDYYRKEGGGLLPVRWMSPESLVDGVFTSQSDVWAFGILLWEIMSMGQQPYQARSNQEVLQYVRGGGTLTKLENCPDDLHSLMLKCWNYNPESRPSFEFCLNTLQTLKEQLELLPPQEIPVVSWSRRRSSGRSGSLNTRPEHALLMNIQRPSYQNHREGTSNSISQPPRYLEILGDRSSLNDGYEIPNQKGSSGDLSDCSTLPLNPKEVSYSTIMKSTDSQPSLDSDTNTSQKDAQALLSDAESRCSGKEDVQPHNLTNGAIRQYANLRNEETLGMLNDTSSEHNSIVSTAKYLPEASWC